MKTKTYWIWAIALTVCVGTLWPDKSSEEELYEPKIVVQETQRDEKRKKPSFPLNNLVPISLDKLTIIPALKEWVICDADGRNEQLLVVNLKSKKIALSAKALGWKPKVVRNLDRDNVEFTTLGFFSASRTAVVYYYMSSETIMVRERIDLNTGAVVRSENLLAEYGTSIFVGPLTLTANKKSLAEALLREHGLGKVICFSHTDPTRLLVYSGDEELFYLDLEAKRLQKIDEHVYSEGQGEFLPRWAGYQDLVIYFKRVARPSDTMELYVANTRGISKCIYSTSLKDEKSACFVSLFIASPNEAWATLVPVKEQVPIAGRIILEYTKSRR